MENNFTYTFRDLPARYGEGDEVYRYTVRESDESKLIGKESSNGENGICDTSEDCKITLKNKYEVPKTPVRLIRKLVNPKTQDEILKYMLMFMVSIIGGFSVIVKEYVLKKN